MREVNKTPFTKTIDNMNPEDSAMLQALYSRSNSSVEDHLKKVENTGSGKFMESFYVGYGHRSIGDCGSTTIFIEGVSNIVAKAIQDNPLYSGQESSTRYLDYSKQAIVDPYNTDLTTRCIDIWLDIYLEYQPIVESGLKLLYPLKEGEKESIWEKAIKARSFDIMRGFLPVGVTTQLSWHTNLRQARDKLQWLAFHPVQEVRNVACNIMDQLLQKYPHSFKSTDMWSEGSAVNKWLSLESMSDLYYTLPEGRFLGSEDIFNCEYLYYMTEKMDVFLHDRPRNGPIPKLFDIGNNFQCTYVLDFGSWRDMQRHRNAINPVPIVYDCGYGINNWYISNARAAIIQEKGEEQAAIFEKRVKDHLAYVNALKNLDSFDYDIHKHQYLYPLGLNLDCYFQCDFSEMVYVSELRSSQHVHPTLRKIAQEMGNVLREVSPDMALYVDYEDDKWSIVRGNQDISEKQ